MTKTCIRCSLELDACEFYAHPQTSDGLFGKCKACCRADASANRLKRLGYYREYDKKRSQNESRKQFVADRQRRYRACNATKVKARALVARAVASGAMLRKPCCVCGKTPTDAHHSDYSKPLDVHWLCKKHHLIEHGNYSVNSHESEVIS